MVEKWFKLYDEINSDIEKILIPKLLQQILDVICSISIFLMVLSRSTSKTLAFDCWISMVKYFPEGSLLKVVKELESFSIEPTPWLLISLCKASAWFLFIKYFSFSWLREASDILDEESSIWGWVMVVVVEKGISIVFGELCKVWTIYGYSFSLVAVWGSPLSWSSCGWSSGSWPSGVGALSFGPSIVVQDLEYLDQLIFSQGLDFLD